MSAAHQPTHPHARAAIYAARLYSRIGQWAVWRYCAKRGVPSSLLVLAIGLERARSLRA